MSPFRTVLEQTFGFVTSQGGRLVAAVSLPALMVGALSLIPPSQGVKELGLVALSMVANAWLALATHRVALLGDTHSLRWGRREWHFVVVYMLLHVGLVGLIIVLSLPIMGLQILIPALPDTLVGIATVGVILFCGYQIAQVSIILPATAIEQPLGIQHAHALLTGKRGTALTVFLLFPLLTYLPGYAMAHAELPMLRTILPAVLLPIGNAIAVLALSFLFRLVVEAGPGGSPPSAGTSDHTDPPVKSA